MTSHTGHLPPNYRWNFWAFFVDFVGYMTCLTFISPSSVLPAFVRELTDSPTLIGLSGTIFAAGYLLPQLLVAHWVRGKPRTKPFLMATLPGRGLFLVITLALWAGMAARPTALLILFFVSLTLFAVNDGASNVPWNEFVARAIPLARRGRLFGLSQIIQGIAGIGAGAVISRILGDTSIQFPNNYIILFLAATAPLIPSSIALMLLKEPPPLETADRALTAARTNWRTILSRDGDYRRILVCRALLLMAGMAIPFYVVHAQDVLGLPGNVIGVFVMAQTLSSVAASALFGFVSDRWGPRYVVRIATIAGGIAPLFALGAHLAQSRLAAQAYPIVYVALGVASSAYMLGFANYLLAISPENDRPTYIGLNSTILGVMAVVPTLGGWILQTTSYTFLFCLAGALGLAAFLTATGLRMPGQALATGTVRPAGSPAPASDSST